MPFFIILEALPNKLIKDFVSYTRAKKKINFTRTGRQRKGRSVRSFFKWFCVIANGQNIMTQKRVFPGFKRALNERSWVYKVERHCSFRGD